MCSLLLIIFLFLGESFFTGSGGGMSYVIPLTTVMSIAVFITISVAVGVVLLKRQRADKIKKGE